MIIRKVLYEIVCDECGCCGNTTPLAEQYPPLIQQEIETHDSQENPLELAPGDATRSETKAIAKKIGWKVGREDLCPKCVALKISFLERRTNG